MDWELLGKLLPTLGPFLGPMVFLGFVQLTVIAKIQARSARVALLVITILAQVALSLGMGAAAIWAV